LDEDEDLYSVSLLLSSLDVVDRGEIIEYRTPCPNLGLTSLGDNTAVAREVRRVQPRRGEGLEEDDDDDDEGERSRR
jgi:hypothetical protein